MKIYGLHKTTLLEYPKHIAAVIFTGGCNMRCPYCHNPELISYENSEYITQEDFFKFIDKRKGILEAVSISGGEPLVHGSKLLDFIKHIKSYQLKVKLDTNGTFPDLLREALVDYIAMDIKTSLNKYSLLGINNISDKVTSSINYILNDFNGEYEFRTTAVPGIVDIEDMKNIASYIKGADNYVISQFRPMRTLDEEYEKVQPYPIEILEEMKEICLSSGIKVQIRANYST